MSITTTQSAPPAAALGPGWIDLPTAAKRSGRSVGHLRRQCGSPKYCPGGATLMSKGLARLVTPAGGGKPEWWVREEADPAFAPVKFAAQIGTDVRHLTDRQRQTCQLRRLILDKWEEACVAAFKLGFDRDAATGRFLQQLFLGEVPGLKQSIEVSRRTLYNWQKAWQTGGLAGLADRRGGKPQTEQPAEEDPFLAEVKRLYLNLRKPNLTSCHKMASLAAAEKGWQVCSRRTAQRFVDALPRAVVLRYRFGEEAYVNEAEPFLERGYAVLRSNEIWVGDHHQFDVIVNDGGKLLRPWITCWQDMRSRKIVGRQIFAHDPNSDTILAALREGMLSHGVPERALIDNGKDYDCYALNGRTKKDRWQITRKKLPLDEAHAGGVFAALDIKPTFCWPYHGQSKPVERWFGTFEKETWVWPTYCGNNPDNKPEDLQLQLERGKAPSMADFAAWVSDWIDAYNKSPHTGDAMDGNSPDAVWQKCLTVKRAAPVELLDVLMLRPTQALKVGQNGVTWQGLRYGQYEPALRELLGKDVVLRVDDRDLSKVQVWTPEGRFVCLAPANEKVPANATAQELRDAIKQKRQDRKTLKEFVEVGPRLAEDLPDKILRARAAAATAASDNPDLPPASIQPVRSPLEDQLPALQQAIRSYEQPGRVAVGAEGMADLRSALNNQKQQPEAEAPADGLSQLAAAMARKRAPED